VTSDPAAMRPFPTYQRLGMTHQHPGASPSGGGTR
jgi:hypothetical protein